MGLSWPTGVPCLGGGPYLGTFSLGGHTKGLFGQGNTKGGLNPNKVDLLGVQNDIGIIPPFKSRPGGMILTWKKVWLKIFDRLGAGGCEN